MFGTDGIRGTVGLHPITPDTFLKLGWAIGKWLKHGKVLLGKDTRLSGYMLESALESGLSAAGIDTYLLGPMPTPAISYLTQSLRAQAGLVISASHNPYHDNGLKIFSSTGLKLTSFEQNQIYEHFQQPWKIAQPSEFGKAFRVSDACGRYIEYIKSQFHRLDLSGLKIAVDCAHGALYSIAPTLFKELNADLFVLGNDPNGYNINLGCGALETVHFAQYLKSNQVDLGFSFDGDGDRLVVFWQGEELDPNHVLYALCHYYQLSGNIMRGIVGTHLTNLGLVHYLDTQKIPFVATDVGDRHVIKEILARNFSIGGEPSGHYLLPERIKTADAMIASLAICSLVTTYNINLNDYRKQISLYPCLTKNIDCHNASQIFSDLGFSTKLADIQNRWKALKVIVRPSGTEPKIRIQIEGSKMNELEKALAELVEHIEQAKIKHYEKNNHIELET